ncbi:hypothetical protein RZS08_64890, partial [Arthrospira platensis SPKY1]|nr:hypothetical protein [Arthrospira platensis SPKY1]
QPDLAEAVGPVQRPRRCVAFTHLQPQALRALAPRPEDQGVKQQARPALAPVVGRNGDVQQVHLVDAPHGHQVAQQHAALMPRQRGFARPGLAQQQHDRVGR